MRSRGWFRDKLLMQLLITTIINSWNITTNEFNHYASTFILRCVTFVFSSARQKYFSLADEFFGQCSWVPGAQKLPSCGEFPQYTVYACCGALMQRYTDATDFSWISGPCATIWDKCMWGCATIVDLPYNWNVHKYCKVN